MIGQSIEFVLNSILSSPAALAVLGIALTVLGAVWYRAQVLEAREGEALRKSERERPESMWNQ